MIRRFFEAFNVVGQCRRYRVSIWTCPPFLFIVMGVINIVGMWVTYLIANRFTDDPAVAVVSVSIMTAFLFIVGHTIVASFERLADASRLKSEFIGIVSHQLRSPLSAIKWQLEIILEHMKDTAGESLSTLKTIRDQNERMIALVNDLLEVNRIEDDRLVLRPTLISLNDFMNNMVKEYLPRAKSNNIEIVIDQKDLDLWVFVDESKLRWINDNLLDNAIRYTRERGDIKIKVFKNGEMCRVEIADGGIGIPLGDQSKIFTQFFRSENALRLRAEGTGLGLYLVKELIRAMGGKVGFASLEGKGSTFWFTIPTVKKESISSKK